MNGAMAEALAGAEGEQDMDKKIEQALACPCLGKCPAPPACSRRTPRRQAAPPLFRPTPPAEGDMCIVRCVLCAGDLKEGPCGPKFVHAFGCFIRSEHEVRS